MTVGNTTTFSEVFDCLFAFVLEELRLKRSRTPATLAGLGSPAGDRAQALERLTNHVEVALKQSTGSGCNHFIHVCIYVCCIYI